MRKFLIVGATLARAACGGGGTESDSVNVAADNMMMDQNMAIDPALMNGTGNMAMDPAMANGAGNAADPATQNMMQQDMNTNDPDTNLANGM